MPMIIVTLIIGAVAGLFAPRRVALAVTGAAGVLTVVAFVRAFTDGQGNDPWWIIPEALIGCGVALVLADGLSRRRQHRTEA